MIKSLYLDDKKSLRWLFVLLSIYYLVSIGVQYVTIYHIQIPSLISSGDIESDSIDDVLSMLNQHSLMRCLLPALFLTLKTAYITVCLYIGNVILKFSDIKISKWLLIVVVAQLLPICCTAFDCGHQFLSGTPDVFDIRYEVSLLKLFDNNISDIIRDTFYLTLSSIHLVELFFWLLLSFLISKLANKKFWKSFKFVVSTYGIGFLLYLVALTLFCIIC